MVVANSEDDLHEFASLPARRFHRVDEDFATLVGRSGGERGCQNLT